MTPQLFKFIRQSNGLTQDQFAEELDVSRSLVSQIETGDKPISRKTKSRIRRIYGEDYVERCKVFLGDNRS